MEAKRKNLEKYLLQAYLKTGKNVDKIKAVEETIFLGQPKEYSRQMIRLAVFLDPASPLGKFSETFRKEFDTDSPQKLASITNIGILPGVFMNKTIPMDTKVSLYKKIEEYLDYKEQELLKDAARNTATIVYKENGVFYDLDLDKLLDQLKRTGVAKNYITGADLSSEVQSNLRARHIITEPQNHCTVKKGRMTSKVLEENTLSAKIFKDYADRIQTIKDTILAILPIAEEKWEKELNKLKRVEEELDKRKQTIAGIISLVKNVLDFNVKNFSENSQPIDMNLLYQREGTNSSYEENLQKEQYINDLREELRYLENLRE